MRAQDKSNLVKVGMFVTALSIVMMILIVAIGKESSLFSPKSTIRARVFNAENLKTGAVVELKGLRIGTVEEIRIISQQEVEISLSITSENLNWIKNDSMVAIQNAGLVGDKYIEIKGGGDQSPTFNPEKDILAAEASLDLKAIATKGGNIADKADRIMTKLELLIAAIEPEKINKIVNNLSTTTENFAKTTAPMSSASQKMDKAMGKLELVMSRVESGPGTAHSLIYDDEVYEKLRKLMGGAERNSVIKYFIRESIKKAPENGN
ncbi:MAG: MlaD family protein [Proteobacteria bacterium]|nr:MlaD family protein [Pseudomonadota bacterium]